jgi:steroid delta-isomerase-like uncharacterized protein
MVSDPTEAEQVVHDAFDWLNGDATKIDVIAESVDVYGPALPEGEVHSRSEFASFIEANHKALPDVEFAIQELLAGEGVAMAEFTLKGTHQGDFMGIPPTYRTVEMWVIDKFLIEDGKVVEWRSYFDSKEIPKQLGLSFPAVLGQLPKLVWRKLRSAI